LDWWDYPMVTKVWENKIRYLSNSTDESLYQIAINPDMFCILKV